MAMNDQDGTYLDLTIRLAEQSIKEGNFPVGAVLLIDGQVFEGRNTGETSQNYSNHAETSLIISHGNETLQAWRNGKSITLYSSLEPCLMCLGVATMNKVDRIVYAQPDPLAGACMLDPKQLAVRYHETWPEIICSPVHPKSKQLIIDFAEAQIAAGKRVEWHRRFIKLMQGESL